MSAVPKRLISTIRPTESAWHPYDNAKAESFMKTLKVEEVYLTEYESFEDGGRLSAALHRGRLQCQAPSLDPRLQETNRVRRGSRPADGQLRGLLAGHPRGAVQSSGVKVSAN